MQKSIYNDVKIVQLFKPANVTSDQTSITAVDTKGYGSCLFVANIGQSGDTLNGSNYIELETEHSTDNTNFDNCSDTEIEGAVTGTVTGTFAKIDSSSEDELAYKGAYIGGRRYARPVINVTGTHSNGTIIGIIAILSNPQYAPAA